MKSLAPILALLLIATLAAQQQVVVVSRGRTDGGSGISGCPAAGPAFITTVGSASATYAGTDGSGTATGGATIVENPASSGRYILRYDGNNQNMSWGSGLDSLTDLTACGWYAIDQFTAGAQHLIGKSQTGLSAVSWRMTLRSSTFNSMIILMQNTSGVTDSFASDDESLAAFDGTGTFVHLCGKLVCTGMTCSAQLYIDGVPVTTTQTADNAGTLRDDTAFLVKTGTRDDNADDYDGDMAGNQEVWTPSISDACVAERFATGRP